MISEDELRKLDPQKLAQLLNEIKQVDGLPYIANLKQREFHNAPERGASQPVLYGGAMGGARPNRNLH